MHLRYSSQKQLIFLTSLSYIAFPLLSNPRHNLIYLGCHLPFTLIVLFILIGIYLFLRRLVP